MLKSRTFILKCSNFVEFSYEDQEDISNFSCHIRPISCIFHPYQTLTKRKKDSGEFQGKVKFFRPFLCQSRKDQNLSAVLNSIVTKERSRKARKFN